MGKRITAEGEGEVNVPPPAEMLVLQLVADGLSSKEIAAKLGKSVKTIETQRASAMRRLGVHNVAGVVRWVLSHTTEAK